MSPVEEFAFLDPWHSVLPDRGVVGIAGSGGCTTVLLACVEEWRRRGVRVLISQTTAHPVPFSFHDFVVAPEPAAVRECLDRTGVAIAVAGRPDGRCPGLPPAELEALRRESMPDVMIVQAHESSGHLLRAGEVEPIWPQELGLALLVSQVGSAGRLWTAATGEPDDSDPPRRVEVADLVRSLHPLLASLPEGVRPLPFLTGLGAWRDLDGMFAIVQDFWDDPRVWVVALAELIGDARRDEADLRGLPPTLDSPFEGSRVYAVYPSALDEP